MKKWGHFNLGNFHLISLTSKYVPCAQCITLQERKNRNAKLLGNVLVECGKKSKGFCRNRSKSSNISSGKVCVKQESPRNKGTLVSGGLFLTVILGLDLMKCISDMHEALRLLYLPL